MTDYGNAYRSHLFRQALSKAGCRHIRTRPYMPKTNGKAERFIQTSLREWAYAQTYGDVGELLGGELEARPELDAAGLGPGASLRGPRHDQLTLELGKPGEHRHHQPAVWRGRVGPSVLEGAELGSLRRDRRLGILERAARYPALEPILGRPIRTDIIRESWDDLIHVAASIQARATLPSAMLKKLAAHKRQNRLDLALGELGRLERTFFTLDWLESPELCRRCHAGLNKSETRHVLAQAVFAHKQGRIVDRTLGNQEHRTSGLNLVIAAIAYWGSRGSLCRIVR